MSRPKHAIRSNRYRITAGPVKKTGHVTFVAQYKDFDEQKKVGYGKYCDESYPPLLALYNVAISEMIRASLGERAAKDILIYDGKDTITGTLSRELPDFIPFLAKDAKDHKDPEQQRLACPDVETLFEENFGEIAAVNYIFGNDDWTYANGSLKGVMDFDMFCYEVTSILKGPRLLSKFGLLGSPKDTSEISGEEIKKCALKTKRCYWVGQAPQNYNYPKQCKSDAFQQLENHPDYPKQFFNGLLKILLAFDKPTMKKRFNLCLGKEKINLESLPPEKKADLLAFGKQDNLFYSKKGKRLTFVDHVCKYFDIKKHRHLESVLINEVPEFYNHLVYLKQNPLMLNKIKNWFATNHQNHFPIPMGKIERKFNEIWHHFFKPGIDDEKLQKIWQQVFKPKLDDYLTGSTQIKTARYEPHVEYMKPHVIVMVLKEGELTAYWLHNGEKQKKSLPKTDVEDIIKLLPETGNTTADSGIVEKITTCFHCTHVKTLKEIRQQMIDSGPDFIKIDDFETVAVIDKKMEQNDLAQSNFLKVVNIKKINSCGFKKVRNLLKKLQININREIKQYYEKINPTEHDNHLFIEKMNSLLDLALKQYGKLKSSIFKNKQYLKTLKKTGNDLVLTENFEDFYQFVKNLKMELQTFRYIPEPIIVEEPSSEEEEEEEEQDEEFENFSETDILLSQYASNDKEKIAKDLGMKLKHWVAEHTEEIKKIIHEVSKTVNNQPSSFIGWALNRFRGQNPTPVTQLNSLNEIFALNEWSDQSLATQVIKKICLTILKNTGDEFYQMVNSYCDDWWANIAENIVKYSGLCQHKCSHSIS